MIFKPGDRVCEKGKPWYQYVVDRIDTNPFYLGADVVVYSGESGGFYRWMHPFELDLVFEEKEEG
jgi:hypothetical protein